MNYNEIGKTGMRVSNLSFGASSLGGVYWKKCLISFGCFKKYAHICTGISPRYLQSNRIIIRYLILLLSAL